MEEEQRKTEQTTTEHKTVEHKTAEQMSAEQNSRRPLKAVQMIQLGTVMGSEKDALETMRLMKEAGYDGIELNGFMIKWRECRSERPESWTGKL
jgi:hypothetical protein